MKKHISAYILSSLILASALSACGENAAQIPSPESGADAAIPAETAPQTDEYGREIIASSLPDDIDLEGKTVTVYYRPDMDGVTTAYELVAEAENGEIINDAVYKRNRDVEERLNVKLAITNPGTDDNAKYQKSISASVLAGDNAFDIAPLHGYYGPTMASEGYFYNLLSMKHLDLSKPWWNADFVDQMSVFGTLWLVTGDISLTATNRVFAAFFDKKTAADYYPEADFYDEVRQGKWTIDRFGALVKDAYTDLDGDSKRDRDDFYACFFPTASTPLDALEESLEVPITAKNPDGVPEIVYNSTKTAEAYQKVYDLILNSDGVFAGKYSFESVEDMRTAFIQGRSIFALDVLNTTETMRDMEDDYGVLPIFKWDESQEKYKTAVQDAYSIFTVSAVCSDPDAVSAVLEAMGEYSYQYCTPAYFEIALKRKYARGENDAEMYDIILAGRGFNFGVVYSEALGNLIHQWRILLDGRKDTWQSTIEKLIPKSEESLDKLLTAFEELSAR